jgi:hypothetical protein
VACLSFSRVACTNSETAVRIFINFTTESLTKFSDWTTEKSWFNFRLGKMFSLFERSETFSGFLPASCSRGRVRSFGEPERPGNKADQSRQSGAPVKNETSYVSALPCGMSFISNLSDDRSTASSKTIPPLDAI